jgi:hypothetical protein
VEIPTGTSTITSYEQIEKEARHGDAAEYRKSFDLLWLERDLLIMSRETARFVHQNQIPGFGGKDQEEGEFNSATLLLSLLRQLQVRRKARGVLLLSATPMQTSPWEPWDLLAVLGEGGGWLADFQWRPFVLWTYPSPEKRNTFH